MGGFGSGCCPINSRVVVLQIASLNPWFDSSPPSQNLRDCHSVTDRQGYLDGAGHLGLNLIRLKMATGSCTKIVIHFYFIVVQDLKILLLIFLKEESLPEIPLGHITYTFLLNFNFMLNIKITLFVPKSNWN